MPKKMEDMIKIKIVKNNSKKIESENIRRSIFTDDLRKESKEIKELKDLREIKTKSSRYKLWVLALISIIILFFSLSYVFSSATITITPKIEDKIINQSLEAIKDSTTSAVSFDLVVISGEESIKVNSENKESLEVKAKGTAVLYNSFSTKSQTLNINTQLEGSNGKIYKTEKRVVVPGFTKDGKPGSIEVGIYGAGGGESYNSGPLDFKILGFKGTPKYAKIYGRSKGDIKGGLRGEFYTISVADQERALNELKDILRAKLSKKAIEQIPKGFVLFKDSVFLNINDELVEARSLENVVPLSLKGTLYGFLFDEKKLTKKIANSVIEKYDGSDVYISNIKDLSFALTNKDNTNLSDVKNINFTLKGNAKIVWNFDVNKFVSELLGKDKKDFNGVLLKYLNVSSANIKFSPFWHATFPKDTKDIKIIVNYP